MYVSMASSQADVMAARPETEMNTSSALWELG